MPRIRYCFVDYGPLAAARVGATVAGVVLNANIRGAATGPLLNVSPGSAALPAYFFVAARAAAAGAVAAGATAVVATNMASYVIVAAQVLWTTTPGAGAGAVFLPALGLGLAASVPGAGGIPAPVHAVRNAALGANFTTARSLACAISAGVRHGAAARVPAVFNPAQIDAAANAAGIIVAAGNVSTNMQLGTTEANKLRAAVNEAITGVVALGVGGGIPAVPPIPPVNAETANAIAQAVTTTCLGGGVGAAAGNPQQNLPNLGVNVNVAFGGVAPPNVFGECNFAFGALNNAAVTVSAGAPYGANMIGFQYPILDQDWRDSVLQFCSEFSGAATNNNLLGTPLVNYVVGGVGAAARQYSRIAPNERGGLSYSMGMNILFLIADLSGFTHLMHIPLLDSLIRPIPAGGMAAAQGSQYTGAGNQPDVMAISIAAPQPTLHILEAKSSMVYESRTLVGAQEILLGAMDQCNRYQSFIYPPVIPALPAIGGWGNAAIFNPLPGGPGAGAQIFPTSRVATLANWNRAAGNRWEVYVTDPSGKVPSGCPEFFDGYLRLYYANYKKLYFDSATKYNKKNITYSGKTFEAVVFPNADLTIGIDQEILNILREEPEYSPAGQLTQKIAAVLANPYKNDPSDPNWGYVNNSGIYTAKISQMLSSKTSRFGPTIRPRQVNQG
jgi:hypothetical protein